MERGAIYLAPHLSNALRKQLDKGWDCGIFLGLRDSGAGNRLSTLLAAVANEKSEPPGLLQRPLGFVPFPLAFRAAIPARARAGPTRLTVHAPGKITKIGVITRR